MTYTINGSNFTVWVADTDMKREQGLQGVTDLEDGTGMVFTFSSSVVPTMWMKNTLVPLDIVWIDDALVVDITENVQPELGVPGALLKKYSPSDTVDQVLELPAGSVQANGLEIGDSVSF